jgi:hypothetical protein
VNFPEQEYKDFFGGTVGTADAAEFDKHHIGIRSGSSEARNEYTASKRMNKFKNV